MNKHELIQQLSLQSHPEGGYYSEIYRSEVM
ncbi:MAG: cupin domain-containing protein, partial [Symploca sp. SIO2D2]|nr:cupin domain-containing protein [Symploca sp. SIO2D2]